MFGEAFGSFACFCGCLPPPALKGIMMVQNKTQGRAVSPFTLDTYTSFIISKVSISEPSTLG